MSKAANLSPAHLFPQAWETFKARPGLCIAMTVLYGIIQPGGGGGGGGNGVGNLDTSDTTQLVILGGLIAIVLTIALVQAIFAGPVRGGYDLAMLRLVRGDNSVVFSDLFKGFSKFLPLLLTFFMVSLATIVGFVLLVVPGVIVMLGLWPAYLLVMEDDLSPTEAIKGAWALTNGHKLQLFVIALVSMCVLFLGLLACCIGLLVAGPIIQLTWMGAYHELRLASGAYGSDEPAPETAPAPASEALPSPTPEPASDVNATTPDFGDDGSEEDDEPTIEGPVAE